jgi:hypothetical protein
MNVPFDNFFDTVAGPEDLRTNWPTEYCEQWAPRKITREPRYFVYLTQVPVTWAYTYQEAVAAAEFLANVTGHFTDLEWVEDYQEVERLCEQVKLHAWRVKELAWLH